MTLRDFIITGCLTAIFVVTLFVTASWAPRTDPAFCAEHDVVALFNCARP